MELGKISFREELSENSNGKIIFDGGMGTYFSASENRPGQGCEMANLDKPLLISAIHQEYLEAGARAIKTNTFASNRIAYPDATDLVRRQIRARYGGAGFRRGCHPGRLLRHNAEAYIRAQSGTGGDTRN